MKDKSRRERVAGVFLACAALWSGSAQADTFTTAGLSFSDELGGFRLISVSGTGTISDPIVVVEEITHVGPAVLVVRGTQLTQHKDQRSETFLRLAIIKIVINNAGRVWVGFDLELQETLNQPSPYLDGLSFDQLGIFAGNRFQSEGFTTARRVSEPYDQVRFYGGAVDPGEAVRFNFYITDPTPKLIFFLRQEPQLLLAALPGGSDASDLATATGSDTGGGRVDSGAGLGESFSALLASWPAAPGTRGSQNVPLRAF